MRPQLSYEEEKELLVSLVCDDYTSYCNRKKMDKMNYKNAIRYFFENYDGICEIVKDADEDGFYEKFDEYVAKNREDFENDYDSYDNYKDLCDRNRGI